MWSVFGRILGKDFGKYLTRIRVRESAKSPVCCIDTLQDRTCGEVYEMAILLYYILQRKVCINFFLTNVQRHFTISMGSIHPSPHHYCISVFVLHIPISAFCNERCSYMYSRCIIIIFFFTILSTDPVAMIRSLLRNDAGLTVLRGFRPSY